MKKIQLTILSIAMLILGFQSVYAQTGCIDDASTTLSYNIGTPGGPPDFDEFNCSIEVCIIQHIMCKDDVQGLAWRTCSILYPNKQSNITYKSQLNFQEECCELITDEITFRSTNGETITFSGIDAQKFINIISTGIGQMNVGLFHLNCIGEEGTGVLTLDGLNLQCN